MELHEINNLLESYFEGKTSLEEENKLMDYFNKEKVADQFLIYKPVFVGLQAARKEKTERDFRFPKKEHKTKKIIGFAVALSVLAGIGGFFAVQNNQIQKEKEALAAFEESRKTLALFSEKFNQGTEQLRYLHTFSDAKNLIFETEEN